VITDLHSFSAMTSCCRSL